MYRRFVNARKWLWNYTASGVVKSGQAHWALATGKDFQLSVLGNPMDSDQRKSPEVDGFRFAPCRAHIGR